MNTVHVKTEIQLNHVGTVIRVAHVTIHMVAVILTAIGVLKNVRKLLLMSGLGLIMCIDVRLVRKWIRTSHSGMVADAWPVQMTSISRTLRVQKIARKGF